MAELKQFVEVLEQHLDTRGRQNVFLFLEDGEEATASLTYAQLARRAQAVAAELQRYQKPGDRVLLLYPSCIDYMVAFFACLYAGMIAVPIFPPRSSKHNARLEAVVRDCGATLALTTVRQKSDMRLALAASEVFAGVRLLCSDEVPETHAVDFRRVPIAPDTVAFLQYTSGSTGQPKGVMITHANLIYNARMIQAAFLTSAHTIYVTWLPIHHDMGLIGQMLKAVWLGTTCYFMSPVRFLQRPFRWLQAVSRYRAEVSGGPNFAYDLCVDKITEAQAAALDLSHWRVAFNGAEPVRHATLERFARHFSVSGFRRRALHPCYGMAETTLIVSGGHPYAEPVYEWVDKQALGRGVVQPAVPEAMGAQPLVGCGHSLLQQTLCIVDPANLTPCADGHVGEIWVAGEHIGAGYWDKPGATDETFQAHTAGGEGPFLRTGDLGYLSNGDLYVTGRLKDVIIIYGVNCYPQDIEQTVGEADPAMVRHGACAFALRDDNGERVIVVAEVERSHVRKVNATILGMTLRQVVLEQHDVRLADVVLIRPGALPRTSSGKVQRSRCRELYLANKLVVVDATEVELSEAAAS